MRGSADIEASGTPGSCKVDISGSADVDLSGLSCRQIQLTSMGSADATVYASDSISGLLQGAGDVHVLGSPAQRTLQARGAYDISFD